MADPAQTAFALQEESIHAPLDERVQVEHELDDYARHLNEASFEVTEYDQDGNPVLE